MLDAAARRALMDKIAPLPVQVTVVGPPESHAAHGAGHLDQMRRMLAAQA